MTDSPDKTGSGLRSSATSRSLLQQVLAADGVAWDRLVNLYAPLVFYWCRQARLQEEDAADILQEVFLAVSNNLGRFHKDRPRDTFRGWLRVITQNKILDLHRRRTHEPDAVGGSIAVDRLASVPAPVPAEDRSSADEQAERTVLYRSLDFLRGEFEPRTWQAFWKTVVDGRPTKDVADELHMTPGAVRVAKSRVLNRLRQELGDLME